MSMLWSQKKNEKGNLKTHMIVIHEENNSFQCQCCDHKLNAKSNMKQHMIVTHEGNKSFKCQCCDHK